MVTPSGPAVARLAARAHAVPALMRAAVGREPWILVGAAHLALALSLSGGHFTFGKYPQFAELLRINELRGEQASAPSPLYLLFNFAWPLAVMKVLHFAAGLFTLRAVWLLAREGFGPAAGLAAAALLAFARSFVVFEQVLEPDFMLMAALCCGVERALLAKSSSGSIVGSILLGAAVSLRPVVLPAALVATAIAFGRDVSRRKALPALARTWIPAGLALLVAMAGPTMLVGAMARAPWGSTMSGGAVLHMGSRPEGTGDGGASPYLLKLLEKQFAPQQPLPDYGHELYRSLARVAEGSLLLSPGECQRYWTGFWTAYRQAYPGAFARIQLHKIVFALTGSHANDVRAARETEEHQLAGLLPYDTSGLCFLALLGLGAFLALGRGVRSLALVFAALLLSMAAFYVSARYGVALAPYQAVFAAAPLALLRAGDRRPLAAGATLLAGLGAVLLFRSEPVRENARFAERVASAAHRWSEMAGWREAHDYRRLLSELPLALADLPDGEWEADYRLLPFESREIARQAAAASEARWGSERAVDRAFLVRLHEQAGECAEVERLAATLPVPAFVPAYHDLLLDPFLSAARCACARRDWPAAAGWVERSLANRPGNREGLAFRYAVASAAGDRARAAQAHAELFRLHDLFSAELALAHGLRATGDLKEAEKAVGRDLLVLRGFFYVRYEHALVLAAEGRLAQSAAEFNRTVEMMPVFNYRVAPLVEGFERLYREAPDSFPAAKAYARVLARSGRIAEAVGLARAWRERGEAAGDPSFGLLAQSLGPWLSEALPRQ